MTERRSAMKKSFLVLLAVPLGAMAAPPPGGPGPGPGGGGPPGEGPGWERLEKRARLARTLGLAEALDLSEADALKMRELMARFDEKRAPLQKQVWEGMQVLRRAATGDQAAQKDVDTALKGVFDARAQIQALDREMFQAVTKGLGPEQRAKAAVFFALFQGRLGGQMGKAMQMRHGMGPGMGPGRGMGPARGMGPGMEPGAGMMGMGPMSGECPGDCPMMGE
jgi:hypothetical protein